MAGAAASLPVNGTAWVPGRGTREHCDLDMQETLESEAKHQLQGTQRGFLKFHGRENTEEPQKEGQEAAGEKRREENVIQGKCMRSSIYWNLPTWTSTTRGCCRRSL